MAFYPSRIQTLFVIVISLSLSNLVACGKAKIFQSKSDTSNSEVGASFITANTYGELTSSSSLVAIGSVIKKEGEFNIARNSNDYSQPDPNIYIVGQIYVFEVESYLKGKDNRTISIVQPEGILGESTPKTQENIEASRQSFQYILMQPEKKYLVFLNPLIGFPKGEYYIGSIHPWRFDISDSEKVVPESPWEAAKDDFPPQQLSKVAYQIEHPEFIPTPEPAIETYPAPDSGAAIGIYPAQNNPYP